MVHTKLIQIKMAKEKKKMHFGSIERFHTPIRRNLEKSDGKYIKSGFFHNTVLTFTIDQP